MQSSIAAAGPAVNWDDHEIVFYRTVDISDLLNSARKSILVLPDLSYTFQDS